MKVLKSNVRANLAAFAIAGGVAATAATALAATSPVPSSGTGAGVTSAPTQPAGSPDRSGTGGYGPARGRGRGMMGHGWGGGHGRGMMGEWGGGWDMGPRMAPGLGFAAATLGLSGEQETQIEKIQAEVADQQWDLAGKIFASAGKLHDLLTSEAPDRSAVEAAYKALSDLRLQQLEARLDTRAKINAVLTKEQRERLKIWRDEVPRSWR